MMQTTNSANNCKNLTITISTMILSFICNKLKFQKEHLHYVVLDFIMYTKIQKYIYLHTIISTSTSRNSIAELSFLIF
jgi:hypothetical protein